MEHPFPFVARNGFRELLELPDAGVRAVPLLSRLLAPIRAALTSTDDAIYAAGLEAVRQLSNAVGPELTPHLKQLIAQIARKATTPQFRDHVLATLHALEGNGGEECCKLIKAKIPTYCSIAM